MLWIRGQFGSQNLYFGDLGVSFWWPCCPLWWLGASLGRRRGRLGVRGRFCVHLGWTSGACRGSLWVHLEYVFWLFGVKVGGWIADPCLNAFWVEKRPEDGGFMLLKQSKYCGFRKVAFFSKINDFLDLGVRGRSVIDLLWRLFLIFRCQSGRLDCRPLFECFLSGKTTWT